MFMPKIFDRQKKKCKKLGFLCNPVMLQKDFVPGQRIWVEMTIFPTVATRINRLDVSTQRKFQSSKALNWFYLGDFFFHFWI